VLNRLAGKTNIHKKKIAAFVINDLIIVLLSISLAIIIKPTPNNLARFRVSNFKSRVEIFEVAVEDN
jgi:hypothetical protein